MFNILLIDDEEAIRFTLESILEDEGYNIFNASNATEGLTISSEENIHLAIIDLHIPDMSGEDLILKIHDKKPEIKIIIHTGDMDYLIPQKLANLGLNQNQILTKPILDMDILIDKITSLLT